MHNIKEEENMDFLNDPHDPRFAGIEKFKDKVWNGVYYWGNQEEKP